MAIDMHEILLTSQAQTTDAAGKAFTASMSRQHMIGDRKFDEVDVEQAVANRYSTTGRPASGE